jgi:hypothetical protein
MFEIFPWVLGVKRLKKAETAMWEFDLRAMYAPTKVIHIKRIRDTSSVHGTIHPMIYRLAT